MKKIIWLALFIVLSISVLAQYPYNSNPLGATTYLDLNYTTGTNATDRIGGKNFTAGGISSWDINGKYGQAFFANDLYSLDNISGIFWMNTTVQTRTVLMWLNVSAYASCTDGTPCTIWEATDGTDQFMARLVSNGILKIIISNQSSANLATWTAASALSNAQDWWMLTIRKTRCDGDGMLVTVNATVNWTGTWATDAGAGKNTCEEADWDRFKIGDHFTGSQQFAGSVDEVIIDDRLLTNSEIQNAFSDTYNRAPTVAINSPANNNISNTILRVNVNLTDADSDKIANVTLYINNTFNVTLYNVTSGSTVQLNATEISIGDYGWYLYACDNSTASLCTNTSVRNYTMINTAPRSTINSPSDNDINSTILQINVTFNDDEIDKVANITLYLNNSLNTTAYNVTNGTTIIINATGMGNSSFSWYLYYCDNSTASLCTNDTTRTYSKDNETLILTWYNPINSSVVSVSNLSANITITDFRISRINFTVYYPNNTVFYNNLTLNLNTTSFNINNSCCHINFSLEFNYTVEVSAFDFAGNRVDENRTFYADRSLPNASVTAPSGTLSSRNNITLSSTVNDSSPLTCIYWIPTQITSTAFNCSSVVFSVTTDGSFTAFINATDTIHTQTANSSFDVTSSSSSSSSSGGGGGGGGGTQTIIISSASEGIEFVVTSDTNSAFYDFIINNGDSRERTVKIENRGSSVKGIKLECIGEELCQWLTLAETSIDLGEGEKKEVKFTVTIPEDAIKKDYTAKIKASYGDSFGFLNINVDVSSLGFIFKQIVLRLTDAGTPIVIPIWIIILGTFIISFIVSLVSLSGLKNSNTIIILSLSIAVSASTIITLIII